MTWREKLAAIVDRWHAQPAWRKVTIVVGWLALIGGLVFLAASGITE